MASATASRTFGSESLGSELRSHSSSAPRPLTRPLGQFVERMVTGPDLPGDPPATVLSFERQPPGEYPHEAPPGPNTGSTGQNAHASPRHMSKARPVTDTNLPMRKDWGAYVNTSLRDSAGTAAPRIEPLTR